MNRYLYKSHNDFLEVVINLSNELEVIIRGEKIQMNNFVSNVIHGVMLAIIKNLRGVELEEISKIEIS